MDWFDDEADYEQNSQTLTGQVRCFVWIVICVIAFCGVCAAAFLATLLGWTKGDDQ